MTAGRAHVLIVEDDPDIREALAEAVRLEGFTVETVDHGVAALKRLRTGSRPDAVLLDYMLPGMTGGEVLAAARAEALLTNVPVILITADMRIAEAVGQTGADLVMLKPVSLDVLFAALERLLAR